MGRIRACFVQLLAISFQLYASELLIVTKMITVMQMVESFEIYLDDVKKSGQSLEITLHSALI